MARYSWWFLVAMVVLVVCMQQFLLYKYRNHDGENKISLPERRAAPAAESTITRVSATSHEGIKEVFHESFHNEGVEDLAKPTNESGRVAVLIPYTGPALPAWFDTWLHTASTSAPLFDWLIFVTDAPLRPTLPNVKLIRISLRSLVDRIASLDTTQPFLPQNPKSTPDNQQLEDADQAKLTAIENLVTLQPYSLVELKPALAVLFKDYLHPATPHTSPSIPYTHYTPYTHWAYADLDQLIGNVHLHARSLLPFFDIVTFSFGDNYRLYMRGQLTVHKNIPFVNNLWRECTHLSEYNKRLKKWADGGYEKWNFVSAEGCYSKVIADHAISPTTTTGTPNEPNALRLTVLVTGGQLTDAFRAPLDEKESILTAGGGLYRCYEHSFTATNMTRQHQSVDLFTLSSIPLSPTLLHTAPYKCAYWFPSEFQVCLSPVPANADIEIKHGAIRYYAHDRYIMHSSDPIHPKTIALENPAGRASHTLDQHAGILPSHCRQASVSHFQGWKRNYYTFTTRRNYDTVTIPATDTIVTIISEFGFLPLRLIGDNLLQIEELDRLHRNQSIFSTFPRGTIAQAAASSLATEEHFAEEEGLATRYCGGYSDDLKKCVCPLMESDVKFVQKAVSAIAEVRVTLVVIGWWEWAFDSKVLVEQMAAWDGEIIIVVARLESEVNKVNVPSSLTNATIVDVYIGGCFPSMSPISPEEPTLPDNLLYNIALDLVETSYVLVLPVGMRVSTTGKEMLHAKVMSMIIAAQRIQSHQSLESIRGKPDLPVALVLPTVSLVESGDTAYLPHTAYPPPDATCSNQQSRLLFPPTNHPQNYPKLNFSSVEYSRSHTLALPVLFQHLGLSNRAKSEGDTGHVHSALSLGSHGDRIARLPEELSGPGCFGSYLMRVLMGSGYQLRWAIDRDTGNEGLFASLDEQHAPIAARSSSPSCGCVFSTDPNSHRTFVTIANKYYHRMATLRARGIEDVFSRKPFGVMFEQEQVDLMAG